MITFLIYLKYITYAKLFGDQLKDKDKTIKKLFSYHMPRFIIICLLLNVMIEIIKVV